MYKITPPFYSHWVLGCLSMKIQLDTLVIGLPVLRHIQSVNCYFGEFVLSSRIRKYLPIETGTILKHTHLKYAKIYSNVNTVIVRH